VLRSWVTNAPQGTVRHNIRLIVRWIRLTLRVTRLAADRRSQLKLLTLVALMPLRDRLTGPRETTVRLRYRGRDVNWMLGPKSDATVLDQVLVRNEYAHEPIHDPSVILDIGAHAGITLLYFRGAYPTARLIGIEPDPVTSQRLRRNAAQLEGVEVHRLALADRNEEVEFFPAEQGWASSLEGDGKSVLVRGRKLDTLLDDLDLKVVDLLKIDIEGGEFVLTESRRLADVRVIIGELHDRGSSEHRARFFSAFDGFDLSVRGGIGEHTTFLATRRSRAAPYP
jgi:FkbM family methyltransferase